MSINKEKIKSQILKQLTSKAIMHPVPIYRNVPNEFEEGDGEEKTVCEVQGYYYKRNKVVNLSIGNSGEITTNHRDKLLVVCDEDSLLIKPDDFFHINDVKYKIIDLGNTFDVVFDMSIERVG